MPPPYFPLRVGTGMEKGEESMEKMPNLIFIQFNFFNWRLTHPQKIEDTNKNVSSCVKRNTRQATVEGKDTWVNTCPSVWWRLQSHSAEKSGPIGAGLIYCSIYVLMALTLPTTGTSTIHRLTSFRTFIGPLFDIYEYLATHHHFVLEFTKARLYPQQ